MKPKARIKRIQKHLGVAVDGDIGPQTLSAMERAFKLGSQAIPFVGGGIDARSRKNIATLQPNVRDIFRTFIVGANEIAAKHNCQYIIISGNRTWGEQNKLYAKGRTAPGNKVTNARGGYSNHNMGIAVDGGVFRSGIYMDGSNVANKIVAKIVHKEVAKFAKSLGLKWGGDWKTFKDYPHFEYDTGLSLSQMRKKMKAGKAIV